jgi:hypothetical protein
MDTKRPTALLTIQIDHSDLAQRYGPLIPGAAIDAHGYASAVVMRARIPYPFLDDLPASLILRLVPDLPEQVMTCRDGDELADRTIAFLGLAGERPEDPPEIEVLGRVSFSAEMLYPDLLDEDEYIVLEPHADAAHPGRKFAAWVTELIYGDVDDRRAGPWFGASPMAALCAAMDYLEQLALGEAEPQP